MKINGIGTISKGKAMEILTREGREAVKAGDGKESVQDWTEQRYIP